MSTDQGRRLAEVLQRVKTESDVRVLVLMGGLNFFCNGIHLNVIEAAGGMQEQADESWANINAIDDVVREVLLCHDKLTISAMSGNAGAGGVMAALAADYVWTHPRVVLNPSYKALDLYGSEYWTYSLPKRVGHHQALAITEGSEPMSAKQALGLGMVDRVFGTDPDSFVAAVIREAEALVDDQASLDALLDTKREMVDADSFRSLLADHRRRELERMKACFQMPSYHTKRRAFVYKSKADNPIKAKWSCLA